MSTKRGPPIGVGWVTQGWCGSYRGGVGHTGVGWGGSYRGGGLCHGGVRWVMDGWGGMGCVIEGWGMSWRGGVGCVM